MPGRMRGAALRIVTAFVALPVVLALLWQPGLSFVFAALVGLLAAVGLYEFYAIARAGGVPSEAGGGVVAGTLVALSGATGDPRMLGATLYGACLLVALLHIARGKPSAAGVCGSITGIVYVGGLSAHVLLLRAGANGPAMVTLLLVAVTLTDTAAYLFGSLFGRHKLAPRVSPKKSWEGAVAGVAAAVLGAGAVCLAGRTWFGGALPDWTLARYLACGALLSIAAQVGDLTESVLKRGGGVKDSGGFFPGHGGVLDRCDGILFAAPVLYYVFAPLLAQG